MIPWGFTTSLRELCPFIATVSNIVRPSPASVPRGATELVALRSSLFLKLYEALKDIPLLELSSDWQLLPLLLSQPAALLKLLARLQDIQASAGQILDQTVQDPFVRQLIDLECFLLSGLKAQDTVAPEMAFMFGERQASSVDYPVGGSGAIVNALVRGFQRWGGQLRLKAHVKQILVEGDAPTGSALREAK